jgi:hypothetical protein
MTTRFKQTPRRPGGGGGGGGGGDGRKASRAPGCGSFSKEIGGFLAELGSDRLSPPALSQWIRTKSAGYLVDSVYLVPVKGDKHYVYTLVTSDKAIESGNFLTLRRDRNAQNAAFDMAT